MYEAVNSYRLLPTGQAKQIWFSNKQYNETAAYLLFTAALGNCIPKLFLKRLTTFTVQY
jgi:hypothetical protein